MNELVDRFVAGVGVDRPVGEQAAGFILEDICEIRAVGRELIPHARENTGDEALERVVTAAPAFAASFRTRMAGTSDP